MESPGKVIAAFLGVFVAGAIFGAFFTVGLGWRFTAQNAVTPIVAPAQPVTTTPAPKTPAAGAQRQVLPPIPQNWNAVQIMRRYAERLDLTEGQKERIDPVFQRAADDYRRIYNNTLREAQIILQRLHQDIARELTSDQREKLEAWQEKQREALQKAEQQKQGTPKKLPPKAKASAPSSTAPGTATPSGSTPGSDAGTGPTGGTGDGA